MRLDGVAAIVTGGASGLGAATVRRLTEAGCRVAVLDINPGANGIICDVADAASAEAAVAKAREMHGPARILVNCAGVGTAGRIVGRDGPMPLAAFERVIRINLIGSFNLLRLAAADMVALDPLEDGERGVIVNTASIAAFEGQIGQPAYAASKAGVVGMTLPAARELARFGVRVVTIARRGCSTRRWSRLCPRRRSAVWAKRFLSRNGSACRRNTPPWPSTSPPTGSSTARQSGWMALCGCSHGSELSSLLGAFVSAGGRQQ